MIFGPLFMAFQMWKSGKVNCVIRKYFIFNVAHWDSLWLWLVFLLNTYEQHCWAEWQHLISLVGTEPSKTVTSSLKTNNVSLSKKTLRSSLYECFTKKYILLVGWFFLTIKNIKTLSWSTAAIDDRLCEMMHIHRQNI